MSVLVIPQSLGYAALAGLPPVMGLYAAIVPTLVYAYIGASSVSAVGPVAITAIMTSSALSGYAAGSLQYVSLAVTLALMVGVVLWLASVLRLGWIMQFVSRGVSAGFISAAALLIIAGQLKSLIGMPIMGDSLISMARSLTGTQMLIHAPTAWLGLGLLGVLLLNRSKSAFAFLGKAADFAKRAFIIVLAIAAIIMAHVFDWAALGIRLLDTLPTDLPHFALPDLHPSTVIALLPSALLIALIAFISSAAIAGNYARLRSQPFSSNRELLGLGFANIASGLTGGFAVAGGLSRTSLNVALGARTPLASVVCALGLLFILQMFGAYLAGLPYALLAALIISSVVSLIDVRTLKSAWQHDKADAVSFLATFIAAITFGLNVGLVVGLLISFAAMIYRSHRVRVAVLGQVVGHKGGSEHFRNIERYQTRTFDNLLILRIDESLYFGNADSVHRTIMTLSHEHPRANEVILVMTAVNHIDLTAQEMLIALSAELTTHERRLHLAEVKGPVMDIIKHSPVTAALTGQLFLSAQAAVETLKAKGEDWHGL